MEGCKSLYIKKREENKDVGILRCIDTHVAQGRPYCRLREGEYGEETTQNKSREQGNQASSSESDKTSTLVNDLNYNHRVSN